MARLNEESDEELPDLADLILGPRLPLAITTANERPSKSTHSKSSNTRPQQQRMKKNISYILEGRLLDEASLVHSTESSQSNKPAVTLNLGALHKTKHYDGFDAIGCVTSEHSRHVSSTDDPSQQCIPRSSRKDDRSEVISSNHALLIHGVDKISDLLSSTKKAAPGVCHPRDEPSYSSSESDSMAVIRFSPPRLKSPLRRPPKAQLATPPQSPSKSKLRSPKKSIPIPATPHRSSLEAFWSQEAVNAWNDEYSPRKGLKSPRNFPLPGSDDEADDHGDSRPTSNIESPRKSPVKKDREGVQARKAFEAQKQANADAFLCEIDEKVGNGQVQRLVATTGGVKLNWSRKLNSTAGRAHWRRESTKVTNTDGTISTTYKHTASIELAEKVIDDMDRLLNVIAHEYCHLANFMISQVTSEPHGASFKRWAAKASTAFADRNVQVTTKHDYEIAYKYIWQCMNDDCGAEYKRHSKSIDPKKQSCGKCRARLSQTLPVARKATNIADANGTSDNTKTEYQQFVKDQFNIVRTELPPGSAIKDVMKELGVRYRLRKGESEEVKNRVSEMGGSGGALKIPDESVDGVASNTVSRGIALKNSLEKIKHVSLEAIL